MQLCHSTCWTSLFCRKESLQLVCSLEWPPVELAVGGYPGFVMENDVACTPMGPFLWSPMGPFLWSKPVKSSRKRSARTSPAMRGITLHLPPELGCEHRMSRDDRWWMIQETKPFRTLLFYDALLHHPYPFSALGLDFFFFLHWIWSSIKLKIQNGKLCFPLQKPRALIPDSRPPRHSNSNPDTLTNPLPSSSLTFGSESKRPPVRQPAAPLKRPNSSGVMRWLYGESSSS